MQDTSAQTLLKLSGDHNILVPLMMIMMMYQVLVKVMSAGLDKSDLMAVSGWARLERGKPHGGFTLGRDFCGIVVEAGLGVRFSPLDFN